MHTQIVDFLRTLTPAEITNSKLLRQSLLPWENSQEKLFNILLLSSKSKIPEKILAQPEDNRKSYFSVLEKELLAEKIFSAEEINQILYVWGQVFRSPYPYIPPLLKRIQNEINNGRPENAIFLLENVTAYCPQEEEELVLHLSNLYLQTQQFEKALSCLTKAQSRRPSSNSILLEKGHTLMLLNKTEEAVETLDQSLALFPTLQGYYYRSNCFLNQNKYTECIEDIEKCFSFSPDSLSLAYLHYTKGIALMRQGRHENALSEIQKSIQLSPNNPEFFINLGICKMQTGDYQGANLDFSFVVTAYPNSVLPLILRAESFLKLGLFGKAIHDWDLALSREPNLPNKHKYLNDRGIAKNQLLNYLGALKDFELALAIKPDYLPALLNKAASYLGLQEYDKAMQVILAAEALAPNQSPENQAMLFRLKGQLQHLKKDFSSALASYNQTLKLEPSSVEALLGRAEVNLDSGLLLAAFQDYKTLMNSPLTASEATRVWIGLAKINILKKNFDDANDALSAALKLSPSYFPGYLMRAKIRFEMRLFENAYQDIVFYLKQHPQDTTALTLAARTMSALGNFEKSLIFIDAVLKEEPSNNEALFIRGILLQNAGLYKEALADYCQVVQNFPEQHEILLYMSACNAGSGEWQTAEKQLNEYIEKRPNNYLGYLKLGALYIKKGWFDKANEQLEKAMNLEPDLADRVDADDLYALGLWMLDQQAPGAALSFFEKALEINPDFEDAIIRKNELIAGPAGS